MQRTSPISGRSLFIHLWMKHGIEQNWSNCVAHVRENTRTEMLDSWLSSRKRGLTHWKSKSWRYFDSEILDYVDNAQAYIMLKCNYLIVNLKFWVYYRFSESAKLVSFFLVQSTCIYFRINKINKYYDLFSCFGPLVPKLLVAQS